MSRFLSRRSFFLGGLVTAGVLLAGTRAEASGWAAYGTLLMQDPVQSAGIIGVDGGIWTWTNTPKIALDEAKALATGLKDTTNALFLSNGIRIGGTKYMFLQRLADGTVVAKAGAVSVLAAPTSKAVVIEVLKPGVPAVPGAGFTKVVGTLKNMGF